MLDVVTMGETMVAMTAENAGSIKYADRFSKHIAGAESNFAIGITRLGFNAGWISKVGDDPLGDFVEFSVRGEGVDVSQLKRDSDRATGLMIKEILSKDRARVYYYRENSAASAITASDIREDYFKEAKYIHLSGITPALSETARDAFFKILEIAEKHKTKVSFDPNIRQKLWQNKEKMKKVLMKIIKRTDIILPGIEEAEILLGIKEPQKAAKEFYKIMKGIVVLKLGEKGALYYDGNTMEIIPAFEIEEVVDPIGAGDAFAAGLIAGFLKGMKLKNAVELANLVGAYCVTVKGDIEGLPSWKEVEVIKGNKIELQR
jgi:2-dehydro-3-deoxygluconokinase